MFNNILHENRVVYEIVDKYCIAGYDTDDNIIRRMRFECRAPKVTDTHLE